MNTIDIIILIPILYGLIRGLFKGLVGEITSLAAVIIGIFCAKIFAPEVSGWFLEIFTMNQQVARVVSYLVIFFTVAICLHLVGKLIEKILSSISLGGVNKVLGALFGAIKLALIVSILLNGFDMLDDTFSIIKPSQKASSVCYEPVRNMSAVAWDKLSE